MFRIGLYISIKIQVDVTTYKVDINIECIFKKISGVFFVMESKYI
jgi:hypothetical protein